MACDEVKFLQVRGRSINQHTVTDVILVSILNPLGHLLADLGLPLECHGNQLTSHRVLVATSGPRVRHIIRLHSDRKLQEDFCQVFELATTRLPSNKDLSPNELCSSPNMNCTDSLTDI